MSKWFLVILMITGSLLWISSIGFQGLKETKGNALPIASIREMNGIEQSHVKINKDYGKMPLYFIPNKGQMNKKVYYYVQGKDKTVYFTSEGITFSLVASSESEPFYKKVPTPPKISNNKHEMKEPMKPSKRWVVKLEFVRAKKNVKPECLEQCGTTVSYFKGKKNEWKTGLQGASKIIYRNLWPGIDLVYHGTVHKMKYEFIVHPGADPSQIKLAYQGAESVKENSKGQLEIKTPVGGFYDDTPEAWQDINGKHETVALSYAIEKENITNKTEKASKVMFGFNVGKYDSKHTLVLDPAVIVYCGYIGGSGSDYCKGICVDLSGCAYVIGCTTSSQTTFPETVGPDLTMNGDSDAFVAKVSADGIGLVYCGYIGGSNSDIGNRIAVDEIGCAYVSGTTSSTELTFPVVIGPDLSYNGGGMDAFVLKVNTAGTNLDYCGYIGGISDDYGGMIVVDASGNSYMTGQTSSTETTFPETIGPDKTYNGGSFDAFVTKIKADGTGLVYCGYIGGSDDDRGYGIALDNLNCVYVCGVTSSTELTFPVSVGPDLTYNGGGDIFIAKINSEGTSLLHCGYIGGTGEDLGIGIAVDNTGCSYLTGWTASPDTTFPVVMGPDLSYNGGYDAFVTKINAAGTLIEFCGYVGGSGDDVSFGISVDDFGSAYISGRTSSTESTFPVILGPDLSFNGSEEAFVSKIKTDGTGLDYCGYIGGVGGECAYGIAVDKWGRAYIGGRTDSTNIIFPVTVGPDLTYNGGIQDAFIAKISGNPICTVNFASGIGGTLIGITNQTVVQGTNCAAVTAVPINGYAFVNWTGTNGFGTTTANPLTVANVTSDMTITANFTFNPPGGWILSEGLQNNMIVYGKAYNGNITAAAGDWIGAFGPGGISDCRAVAPVQSNGNYYMTIGSNENSDETITFKLWPLPSGPSIDGSESIEFISNTSYNGFPIHFGSRGQNIALVNGWNWISFNTIPSDTSFNSVFGSLTDKVEQIKSQNQAAIYSGGNWIGDLTDMNGISDGIMYKVKTNQACVLDVTGITVPFNSPLSLITGWNWTAYLPTLNLSVNDAVNTIMTPVNQVKSQTQSVIKIDSTLIGDLTQMEPNKGYLILMNQAGVLTYPHGITTFPISQKRKANGLKASNVIWPVIKGNQYNMVCTGTAYFEGKPINVAGYYLASAGSKGENDGRSLSPINTDGTYFATILGNTNGETIKFKLINSTIGKTYDLAGLLAFQSDTLKTGFNLKARSIHITSPVAGNIMLMGTDCLISWEAFKITNVKIELYKGGKSLSVIAPSVPATSKQFIWTIPGRMPIGSDYQVKITCIDSGVIAKDISKTFSIIYTYSN